MVIPAQRNPRYTVSINPLSTATINPKFNANINPKFNANINPKFNAKINPKFNANINPKFNANINPKFNAKINPQFNSNINPKFNSNINPQFNSSFKGNFIFDISLNLTGFIVQVNDKVIQIFDTTLVNLKFGVAHEQGGYCLFNLNSEFISHLESDSHNGFNEFNFNVDWISVVK